MILDFVNKIKGWWHKMFDYNKIIKDFDLDMQTSNEMLDAIQEWAKIFNGHEPWIDDNTASLHVAKTICSKVSKAVTIEYKSNCSDNYINNIYQKFLRNKRKNVEFMLGKSFVFFKPYFDGKKICISIVQADKFIPIKFTDDGDLLAGITIDQIYEGKKVYTRLEYNNLIDEGMEFKNIAYEGEKNGIILSKKISLSSVNKWKDIEENGLIEGIDKLVGGFASMKNVNNIDNDSPIGVPIYYNALDTLKEIDKQYSRTLWEYDGTELSVDVDPSVLIPIEQDMFKMPKRKQRLFRKLSFDETKEKNYNIFSPEIRDTSLFNGLNEYLMQAENQCGLAYGTLCKITEMIKTATEIKASKQDYYITVADIQESLQHAFDDLIYGIYVLCKLYNLPVKTNYVVEHNWDDSILVDKDSSRNQSLIERNQKITSDVQYIMETRNMKEKDAIEFIKKQKEYRELTEEKENADIEVDEE